jgi:hypothetical protein
MVWAEATTGISNTIASTFLMVFPHHPVRLLTGSSRRRQSWRFSFRMWFVVVSAT